MNIATERNASTLTKVGKKMLKNFFCEVELKSISYKKVISSSKTSARYRFSFALCRQNADDSGRLFVSELSHLNYNSQNRVRKISLLFANM